MRASLGVQQKIRNQFIYHIRKQLFLECEEFHKDRQDQLCLTCRTFLELIYSVSNDIKSIYVEDYYREKKKERAKK